MMLLTGIAAGSLALLGVGAFVRGERLRRAAPPRADGAGVDGAAPQQAPEPKLELPPLPLPLDEVIVRAQVNYPSLFRCVRRGWERAFSYSGAGSVSGFNMEWAIYEVSNGRWITLATYSGPGLVGHGAFGTRLNFAEATELVTKLSDDGYRRWRQAQDDAQRPSNTTSSGFYGC